GQQGMVEMLEVLPDIYEGRIPVQTRGGGMTYHLKATDPSGNLEQTGARTMVIQDVDPPEIAHVPPQDLVEGQEVTFEAMVTDNVGVQEVWLYLRLTATASFRRLAMDNVEDDTYAYTLAEGELRQPHVMYYFEAEDLPPSSNVATDPDGAPQVTYLLNVTERMMSIQGVVKASGGDPIEGAKVDLPGEGLTSVTDANGSYRFDDLYANTYVLEVRQEGFQTFSTNVVLSAESGDRNLDITLVPKVDTDGEEEGLPWTLVAALIIFGIIAFLVLVMMRVGAKDR
ncbi:MAG: carboxypeptidase regulatory-like domain-containing protein, partial [Thermoplasmata archaeon]